MGPTNRPTDRPTGRLMDEQFDKYTDSWTNERMDIGRVDKSMICVTHDSDDRGGRRLVLAPACVTYHVLGFH